MSLSLGAFLVFLLGGSLLAVMMDYVDDGCDYVTLVRQNSSQPWGFRMVGGQDQGCCLYIAKVSGPFQSSSSELIIIIIIIQDISTVHNLQLKARAQCAHRKMQNM